MTMKGLNTLSLCINELTVALQEYLDKRWPEHTPIIDSLTLDSNNHQVKIILKGNEGDNQ